MELFAEASQVITEATPAQTPIPERIAADTAAKKAERIERRVAVFMERFEAQAKAAGMTPEKAEALAVKLSRFGKVRSLERRAAVAKEAAEGAYIIGEGLMGGKYKGIVDSLQLRRAGGTMFDYILIKGAEVEKP